MRLRILAILFLLAVPLASCARTPDLPADEPATYQLLTGSGGKEFLRQISTHRWDDGGRSAAARFSWIARDANSANGAAAQRAGEAAHTIAAFLAENKDELARVPAGWFGLQHRTIGELNPELVQGYGAALIPFVPALVGDAGRSHGFGTLGSSGIAELSAARNIVSVIDMNTQAGTKFRDAAYEQVHRYLREFAQGVARGTSKDRVGLQHAAELAGVIAGGQHGSHNEAVETRGSQYWVNWAGYEVAAALGARPGDRDIGDQFFDAQGELLPPDQVSANDMFQFATAVANFAFNHGLPNLGSSFKGWFDDGAGK